jgi:hypothetical protein
MIGAAENFARPPARMVVPLGTPVVFRLGPETEGVWYDGACGWLGAGLYVSARLGTGEWHRVGRAFDVARECGPALGHADGPRVVWEAPRPGQYLVHAQVFSLAQPLRPDLGYERSYLYNRALDISTVRTQVRVVRTVTPDDLAWAEAAEEVEEYTSVLLEGW